MEPVVAMTGNLAPRGSWMATQCSMAKALEVVSARSAFLIMREAFYGTTRFDDFVTRVGITEAVAAARLRQLVADGLLERTPYREPGQRTRHEYRVTEKGVDLFPVLVALLQWGDRWLNDGGRVELRHRDCGAHVGVEVRCAEGHEVTPGSSSWSPRRGRGDGVAPRSRQRSACGQTSYSSLTALVSSMVFMPTNAPISLDETYRLVTRSDFDGLVCAALLNEIGLVGEIKFVHPKDVQDGTVELTSSDITTNLPYRPEVALSFDHHASESRRVTDLVPNRVMVSDAASAARVVYDYFGGAERFSRVSAEMMQAVDSADAADLACRTSLTRRAGSCSASSWTRAPDLVASATSASPITS